MFFSGFKLQPEKIMTEKKRTVVRPSVGNWKKLHPENKGTVVSSRRLEGKTQNTTHIIDTTTNKMSRATLPIIFIFHLTILLKLNAIFNYLIENAIPIHKKGTVIWPSVSRNDNYNLKKKVLLSGGGFHKLGCFGGFIITT